MSVLDSNTLMGYPTTGVYHSFNGKVLLAGYDIIRVERANFTIRNTVDVYPEVGRREGTPYVKEFDVRGTISRAYVNGAEWRLAIGMNPSDSFNPGKEYFLGGGGDQVPGTEEISPLIEGVNTYSNRNVGTNTYPIKTRARFEVNSKDGVPIQVGSNISQGKALYVDVFGVMIDTINITIGQGGDPIMSGPINWVGEKIKFVIADVV
jgi:hypothetical protein